MEEELMQNLKDYLGIDYDDSNESALLFCVKRAIKSFSNKRNYPDNYTESLIKKDMDKFYMCIWDLCLYWVAKQGNEFENSRSENGVSVSWDSENDIYALHNVIPISRII